VVPASALLGQGVERGIPAVVLLGSGLPRRVEPGMCAVLLGGGLRGRVLGLVISAVGLRGRVLELRLRGRLARGGAPRG
jgi:hypothetical protein